MCHDDAMVSKQKSRVRGWLSWVGIVALAFASIAAAAAVYISVNKVPSTTTASSQSLLPDPGQKGQNLAVFIGDEFSTTSSVDLKGALWTSEIASVNGWAEVNWSVKGLGFVHRPDKANCAGDGCGNILDQVPRIVAENPSVVFVAAGTSDELETPADVSASIQTVFDALRIGLPSAKIVAVGPASITAIPSPSVLAIDGFVRSASAKMGATYVSLLSPNVIDPTMISSDGNILDSTGQKAMATRVNSVLGVKN